MEKFNLLVSANAYNRCITSNDSEWTTKHREKIETALLDVLPHGSGIDNSWVFGITKKTIICRNSYHCMNPDGYYIGWIDFQVIIRTDHRDIWGKLDWKLAGQLSLNYGLREDLEENIGYWLEKL